MFKKATVVMLPTNQKANFGIGNKFIVFNEYNDPELRTGTVERVTSAGDEWSKEHRGIIQGLGIPKHLYITSDEEIKEGDWFINDLYSQFEDLITIDKSEGDVLYDDKQFIKYSTGTKWQIKSYCIKIIASTDLTLNLPQPSASFITKFIDKYNRGNIITDVMVEYEEIEGDIYKAIWFRSYGNPDFMIVGENNIVRINFGSKEYEQGVAITAEGIDINGKVITKFGSLNTIANYTIDCFKRPFINKLKIDSKDNTVTIKKIKNSWSREEVIELINESYLNGIKDIGLDNHNIWIEKNL